MMCMLWSFFRIKTLKQNDWRLCLFPENTSLFFHCNNQPKNFNVSNPYDYNLRPYKLPRGFSCLIVCVHPPASDINALINNITSKLDLAPIKHPNAGIFLVGNFNYYVWFQPYFGISGLNSTGWKIIVALTLAAGTEIQMPRMQHICYGANSCANVSSDVNYKISDE